MKEDLRPWAAPAAPCFALHLLAAREVHLEGWLKVQAQDDVREGLPGRLDEIMQDVARQMFVKKSAELQQQGEPSWWPGEQEGYWHEGLIHLSFWAEDPAAQAKATAYVEAVLQQQDPDGYIGVYAPSARLKPVTDPSCGELGGELHTQAHLLLALLAFYEHTGRFDVLAAAEKAARLSIQTYADGVFGRTGKRTAVAGGNSHAVTFADALVQLYRLTDDVAYLSCVAGMVADYNAHPPRDRDWTRASLADPARRLVGHGAHTAESFHLLQAAALADPSWADFPPLATARLVRHLTPGGALVSGEMIDGQLGNGRALYEHCTQAELIKSFVFLAQYTADPAMAERAARLFFNGVQGARLHPCAAVQYLSRDDRLDIPTHAAKTAHNIRNEGSHFQLSFIIRPACCAASTGRTLPYFAGSLWMKSADGQMVVAMNPAPCRIVTSIAGTSVRIHEETAYPFDDRVVFAVDPERETTFDLAVRLPPEGHLVVVADAGAAPSRCDGLLVFRKRWKTGDRIELRYDLPVVCEKTQDGAAWYYRRGSLVFGLPFDADVKAVSENPQWVDGQPSGLFEYDVRALHPASWGLRIDPSVEFVPVALPGDPLHPFEKPTVGLRGALLDAKGRSVPATLVPMGAAISRRVTFLDSTASAAEAARLPEEAHIGIGF